MGIRTNLYENNIDYCWYDSSNIIYSECIDKENDFKTLYIIFKNKTGIVKYRYDEINVNDYVMFKNSLSQGKALSQYLKTYKYEKMEEKIIEENLLNREREILIKRREELEKAEKEESTQIIDAKKE